MKGRYHIILLVCGLVIFALGLIIYLVLPTIVHQKIDSMLPIKNGTLIYNQWQNLTIPTYMQFWYFEILNPLEIMKGQKPSLRQIGPYTYQEYRIKYNITFDDGSVSYYQNKTFHFRRDRSVGDENDTFVTVNIPLVVMADFFADFPNLIKDLIIAYVKTYSNWGLFITTSVKNMTWGYQDPLLTRLAPYVKGAKLPLWCGPVGLFYGKNNTNDSLYQVDSGSVNLDNYLKINRWNGSDSLTMWNDRYANMVNGTDGTMFSPFLNKSSKLYAFQSDICRSIYASYSSSGVVNGIPSYNFEAPDELFANSSVNPDNAGFCLDGLCLGAGMLNLSRCIPTAPIVMSQPHFLGAAQKYADSVYGLSPSADLKTVLRVEPTTGLPLDLQKKLQINLAMHPVADFLDMAGIPQVILPMMWLNESALIDDELAEMIRDQLVLPVLIGHWASLVSIVIGALTVVFVLLVNVKRARRSNRFAFRKIVNDV